MKKLDRKRTNFGTTSAQLQSLQHEITRMRAQQDSLKKKIKETTDKYEDEHERDLKTMAVLKREAENQLRRVRELEVSRTPVTVRCLLYYAIFFLASES